jgi:hypothetical protein
MFDIQKITGFGKITITRKDGRPQIEIANFVTKNCTSEELKAYAILYATEALQEGGSLRVQ